jgi:hypothetical protein
VKGAGPALVIGVGKAKGEAMPDDAPEMGDEKEIHLDAAYDAIEQGDREGFKEAMRKCLAVLDEGGYTGPGDEDEG